MWFSLDVIRAREGDCLMVHYGSKDDPHLVMIDGGPSRVYKPHLKPRIDEIRGARGVTDAESLPVDVLMISHVDEDHIMGILDMTRELRNLAMDSRPLPLKIKSLWHNSFDDLLKTTPDELKIEASYGEAALAGKIDVGGIEDLDVAKVLASIGQGRDLRDAADFLKWKPNREFGGELIQATGKSKPIELDGGLTITTVGPMQPELKALQEKHDDWLRDRARKKKEDPKAALAAFEDDAIQNLSSIVVLAEAGGKRILLTGDARGDKMLDGLELVGLLKPGGTMHVDILKIPHHGSDRNVEPIFFERITADHYVFSGNGKHGNPERATLEMLFEARGDDPFVMHFTYPIDEIDVERENEWKTEKWSDKKHGLASFLKDKKVPADRIQIVEKGKPHVIDLLDTVGF